MESIKNKKFETLKKSELLKINGGEWNHWVVVGGDGFVTIEQRRSWFGLYGTTDTRCD